MKVVTVVGARPQFIKAAVVSRVLREKHTEILIHTGQHYDYNMSERFFEELDIPKPDYNLGINGGSHAQMTGNMMIAIEKVLQAENPDWLLIYGDTNSTLAAGIAAAKLHIPICHVEAGARTKCMNSPEEINRICVDHVSTLPLAVINSGMQGLINEGLGENAVFVGDPMYDAYVKYSEKISIKDVRLQGIQGGKYDVPNEYYYLTCHREENTNDDTLINILSAMDTLEAKTIYPVHPRNKERVIRLAALYGWDNIIFVEPIGYIESICLVNNAKKIVTDSGGVQREAFFAKKKCVVLLEAIGCSELLIGNRTEIAKPLKNDILTKLSKEQIVDDSYMPFGDGNSAVKIVAAMENYFSEKI